MENELLRHKVARIVLTFERRRSQQFYAHSIMAWDNDRHNIFCFTVPKIYQIQAYMGIRKTVKPQHYYCTNVMLLQNVNFCGPDNQQWCSIQDNQQWCSIQLYNIVFNNKILFWDFWMPANYHIFLTTSRLLHISTIYSTWRLV